MTSCICAPPDDDDYIHHNWNPLNTPKEKIIKICLLGPSDCGKTTIIKQLKQLSESNDRDKRDLSNLTPYIRNTMVINMKTLCYESLLSEQRSNAKNSVHKSMTYLRDEILSLRDSDELNADIAFKIRQLWHDDGIRNTLHERHSFQIDENIEYFMNKIEVIAKEGFIPNFEDYVRISRRSIGLSPTKFVSNVNHFGEYCFEIPDISGARTERKKWWNTKLLLDQDLTAIIYVIPISDYDLTLFEDNKTNRLIEAINLFKETMIKGDFFRNKPVILLFNKHDIYLEKIKNVPITDCFDDFPVDKMNPNDAEDAMKFVASKCLQVFSDYNVDLKDPLRVYRTTAIDTSNIEDAFYKIMTQIIRKNEANFEYIDSEN